jgi:hypothetical protein
MYLLRCCLEYSDNKKTWRSMWNMTQENATDAAWRQSKDNLLFALIEAKNIVTRDISVVAVCNGDDFCNFQWIATVACNSTGGFNSVTTRGTNIGLKIISRNDEIIVYCDKKIQLRKRTEEEKKINFAAYGK